MSIVKVLTALLLVSVALAGNCGGNCPDNSCPRCLCGTTPNYINLDEYCQQGWRWNQNCCKCIVSKLSRGNEHFQRTNLIPQFDELGVLPIKVDGIEKICNGIDKPTDLCDWRINARCAEYIVIDTKKAWSLWAGAALGCGCPLSV